MTIDWDKYRTSFEGVEALALLTGAETATIDSFLGEIAHVLPVEHPDPALRERYAARVVHYQTSLYALVRLTRPESVFESGIGYPLDGPSPANVYPGTSTKYILAALVKNMESGVRGELYSCDTAYRDGMHMLSTLAQSVLLTDDEACWWNPSTLGVAEALPKAIHDSALDVFLHDGDHSWHSQTFEYELAYRYLKPGGLLLSDDYTWGLPPHGAWAEFVARHRLPWVRLGACAAVRKPDHVRAAPQGDLAYHVHEILTGMIHDSRCRSALFSFLEPESSPGGAGAVTSPEGAIGAGVPAGME